VRLPVIALARSVKLCFERMVNDFARSPVALALRGNQSLKRLQVSLDYSPQTITSLMQELLLNGSLISVEVVGSYLTHAQRRQIQIYSTRNHRNTALFTEMSSHECGRNEEIGALLPMIPSVFSVMQHSPGTALSRMLHGLMAFDQCLGPARGVDGAVPAGGKRLPVALSAVDKRLQAARSAVRKIRAASEAVADDTKAKANIIHALIQRGIDVASELYDKTKNDLRVLSKKEISMFAHRACDAEMVRFYFPDFPHR
jgi:hypothetical protein